MNCANCCSNKEDCFDIDKWFDCDHYQCRRTTIIINYCIECGNNKRIKFFKKRCAKCWGILEENESEICFQCVDDSKTKICSECNEKEN